MASTSSSAAAISGASCGVGVRRRPRVSSPRSTSTPAPDPLTVRALANWSANTGTITSGLPAASAPYTVPEPQGFKEAIVRPGAARYDKQLNEFLLNYEDVRKAGSATAALLEFCQSTYDAGASLGNWDRAALERQLFSAA